MDYGGSAAELEAYFSPCGEIHRVTILCDKFSGHPKGSVWGHSRLGGVGGAGTSLLASLFRTSILPQLCIYRVCFPELCQGCCEDG